MAVHFQKISDKQFHPKKDFIVKDSKTMNVVFGIAFLFIALILSASFSKLFGLLMIIPAILFFRKSNENKMIMVVNKNGFYYYGELLTNWENFISAKFIDELPLPAPNSYGINDEYYLLLKYFKDGESGHFGRKIRLTNNQDKAEEEIMAAIAFYYKEYQKAIEPSSSIDPGIKPESI